MADFAFLNLIDSPPHVILSFIYFALHDEFVQLLFMAVHLTILFNLGNSNIFSSKAEARSNAALQTPSSSKEGEYSGTFVYVQGNH